MKADAIVASDRNRDSERDKLFCLSVQCFRSECRLRKGSKSLHDFGDAASQIPQLRRKLLGYIWPIFCDP
jgi:hypothetical protein